MVHDPVDDIVEAELDKISELPDDVLLDILGRLVEAGDVRAVARTSILSRRWRSLPWPEIHNNFSLDIESFLHPDVVVESPWQHVRRRCREPIWLQNEHRATAGLTDALARFLAAPPSKRVIGRLGLKFILTSRDYVRRIGELVGAAAAAGTAKSVEVELVAKMGSVAPDEVERTKLGYGERFGHFLRDCPAAFRSLTKLTLQNLWFHDPAELNGLVRGCSALLSLSLSSCALLPVPAVGDDVEEPPRRPPLSIDAPESRLQMLRCDLCHIGGVELVRAPELVVLRYSAIVFEESPPVSFGCSPSLKGLHQDEASFAKLKLSELLVNGGRQLKRLVLAFENGKIWLQPENPKQLRAALRGLKNLTLSDISPGCNLSWAMFLLEATPFLDTLDIMICNHICLDSWHKKGDEDANLEWEPETSPDFRHRHLKQLSFKRAFHVEKDLPFARLAVNLQVVTLGVKSLGCPKCIEAKRKYPDLARSRLRFAQGSDYVHEFMKKLMDGITTSAKITLLLADLV